VGNSVVGRTLMDELEPATKEASPNRVKIKLKITQAWNIIKKIQ
jgi:hypothetical protein